MLTSSFRMTEGFTFNLIDINLYPLNKNLAFLDLINVTIKNGTEEPFSIHRMFSTLYFFFTKILVVIDLIVHVILPLCAMNYVA